MYYCYIVYAADYDYGGNVDTRCTTFPVLDNLFLEKQDADDWLKQMQNYKYTGYDLRPYSIEVSEQILYPEML